MVEDGVEDVVRRWAFWGFGANVGGVVESWLGLPLKVTGGEVAP